MAHDTILIEVLEDGTIKTTTDPVSGQNHANADAFIMAMSRLAGGSIRRVKRIGADLTAALHAHTHDGHTHSH